jgi:hypothetical protein
MNVADSYSIKYDSNKRFAKSGGLAVSKLVEDCVYLVFLLPLCICLDPVSE